MSVTRRDCLTGTGGALLAASALSLPAEAKKLGGDSDILYGHGMVWNRELDGIKGKLNLSFDLRVNLETGAGFGSAHDPVYPDWNMHFAINSAKQEKLRKGESRFTLGGVVTEANDPTLRNQPVWILAETSGDTTAIAISIGEDVFAGAGLVVIAIIAVLIGLLLPAVQKVREAAAR